MKSYYEIIENISKGDRNENHSLIAKQIIKNYLDEKIVSQIELANSVFLSKSSITKFGKKNGLDGYRELAFNLRNEMTASVKEAGLEAPLNRDTNYCEKYLRTIEEAFCSNRNLIKELTSRLENTKQISLVVSYSMKSVYFYIERLFFEKNIDVELIEYVSSFSTVKKQINKSSNIVVICIARDNETLNRIYDMVDNKENVIVITTERQSNKFPQCNSKLILKSESHFYNHAFRQILIEMLFLNIFQNLK